MTQQELWSRLTENATLQEVQEYLKQAIACRGFDRQPVQSTLLLLVEDVGELAKAIRKCSAGMSVDPQRTHACGSVEQEMADVFIVLISVCNALGISLFDALKDKEQENIHRQWVLNQQPPVP